LRLITKNIFLNTFTCPTLGWEVAHSESGSEELSLFDRFQMEEGIQVHERARKLFPQGILISGNNESAAALTEKYLQNNDVSVIFEATFIVDGFITKADILIREASGWKIIEVKSGTKDNIDYIEDLAYTTMIAGKAGLMISSCSLMLISKEYRLGMSDEKLFEEVECKREVYEIIEEFSALSAGAVALLKSKFRFKPKFELVCKGCDCFNKCWGEIENHIFDLPRLSHTKFCQLRDMDIVSIEDIPSDFELAKTQIPVWEAVTKGSPVIDEKGLKEALSQIEYPAYYLDFETVTTALPLYENICPYEKIATQYSIHKYSALGEGEEHLEYLADPSKECRRELAESLIRDCGDEGTIFSYSPYEKTVINGLIGLFPDLADELGELVDRLIDLCKILSSYYYHPLFHGSYSIKKVLPVMVPGLSYEGMEVNNGSDAIAVFARMARGEHTVEECEQITKDLLAYCKLDTLAMVKLHEALEKL